MTPDFRAVIVQAVQARLRVFVRGRGPTLILLPGIGRPPDDLIPFAAHLVDAGYRVVLPEPRGMGESTGPLDGITLHDLAADIAAVAEATDGAPVTVIGHAFGNRLARTLAADRPDLVNAVVLMSASGKVHASADIAEANRICHAIDVTEAQRYAAARLAWFAPDSDISCWLTGWSAAVRLSYAEAARATPLSEWYTAGQADVLIVQGLLDVSAPVANGRLLKEELGPRAKLVELPGVAHALPIENPKAVAEAVLDFLSSRVAAGGSPS